MKLSRFWLYWLPLLYLPNLGLASSTQFGTLQISDYLIIPYIVLVFLGVKKDPNYRQYKKLIPWCLLFLIIGVLSTLTIEMRYPNAADSKIIFGLLKLGKLALYALAGLLTARALALQKSRDTYDWSLLISVLVASISLWYLYLSSTNNGKIDLESFHATNATSVMIAIILVYLGGRYLMNANSTNWKKWVVILLPFAIIGFLLSRGRGGWVAALVGVLYLAYRYGIKRKVILAVLLITACFSIAYTQYPVFQKEVDRTLWPREGHYSAIVGIDEGKRLIIWSNSIRQIQGAPLLGTGFFHRGGVTGIYSAGSHNFFLQILLETGFLGFSILCFVIFIIWKQIYRTRRNDDKLYIPVMGAMVTAFIGALSGEYFYGGMVLFTFFLVYGPVGSLPVKIISYKQNRSSDLRHWVKSNLSGISL